ncbi:MAG: hypothetical protein HY548_05885, partial [Elusimicrobia bacterium]|nr:hypothetical protein [Elusimicrobiota bacterium]
FMDVNYAFIPFGDVGNTHRVSLDFRFDKRNKEDLSLGKPQITQELNGRRGSR